MQGRGVPDRSGPETRLQRCEVEKDGGPCDSWPAFYEHEGIKMCADCDRAWRIQHGKW